MEELYNFPCRYTFKVFGPRELSFKKEILALLSKHDDKLSMENFSERLSGNKVYVCLTIDVYVLSRQHVEEIYGQLKKHPKVRYLL